MTAERNGARVPLNQQPEAISYLRTQARLSQAELARRCAVSPSVISEYEGGTRNAPSEMIDKLSEVLNCPRIVLLRKAPDWWDYLPCWVVEESNDRGKTWYQNWQSYVHPCRCLALYEAAVIVLEEWSLISSASHEEVARILAENSVAYYDPKGIRVVKKRDGKFRSARRHAPPS